MGETNVEADGSDSALQKLNDLVGLWADHRVARGIAAEWARRSGCDAEEYFECVFRVIYPHIGVEDKSVFFEDVLILAVFLRFRPKDIIHCLAQINVTHLSESDWRRLAETLLKFNARFWDVRLDWICDALDEKSELGRAVRDSVGGNLEISPEDYATAGKENMAKKHVFLSYCRENRDKVAELRHELLAANEHVWWDWDILPGQDWKETIRQAMRDAYAIVACFSKETDAREQSGMFPELRDAIEAYRQYKCGSIFLIPVRLSQASIPNFEIDSTTQLSSLQYVDLFDPMSRSAEFDRLVAALRGTPHHP